MKLKFRTVVLSVFLAVLSGCLIPEEFDVSVEIEKDGSYTFVYEGVVSDLVALVRLAELSKKGVELDEEILKEIEEYRKNVT